ncbi:MAG TPA: signal peptidase II [Steroidobacteraceae bacterium]|nr:signal peptidase II [Steroidobacteraceae bacterium]HNS27785.1 signal peptidase II [Steroidobacteraceae bacterium]
MSGWRWLPLSALIVALDQATKLWVERSFQLYESVTLLPVFDLTYLRNTGAAFSFLAGAGGWQRWFFSLLAVGVSVGIIVWLRGVHARAQAWLAAGLALILGGALGNVIDRLRLGYVVDFVHVHWQEYYFPAFNVADAAITVGAACVIIDTLLESRRARARGPA